MFEMSEFQKLELDAELWRGVLGVLSKTGPGDPSRPILTGLHMRTDVDRVVMEWTDSHMLIQLRAPWAGGVSLPERGVIVGPVADWGKARTVMLPKHVKGLVALGDVMPKGVGLIEGDFPNTVQLWDALDADLAKPSTCEAVGLSPLFLRRLSNMAKLAGDEKPMRFDMASDPGKPISVELSPIGDLVVRAMLMPIKA